MVAFEERKDLGFREILREGAWTILRTEAMEVRARDMMQPFDRTNLEIRWVNNGLVQSWRPGDRDFQNLGGPIRSLDRYGGEFSKMEGVQPAGMESPDAFGLTWVAWHQDEVDPLYDPLHPQPRPKPPTGRWSAIASGNDMSWVIPERTKNIYHEALRFPSGLLSLSGFFFLNDSDSAVVGRDGFPVERQRQGAQDWFFFAYGRDFGRALADFRALCGPVPMPRRRTLGIQFCRWPGLRPAEVEEIAMAFQAAGHPLTTVHIDMEWHKKGWGHWDFDPEFLPDPFGFFSRCHELGVEVLLNDHPLDVREDDSHYVEYLREGGPEVEIRDREYLGDSVRMARVDICNPQQNRAFRKTCHEPIWELGLDGWWNDGSRGTLRSTHGQLVSNFVFFEDSRRHGFRGLHLARYGGWGSHRYGMTFTGDAACDFGVLSLQCEYNIRAAGAGLAWISHDIGGFAAPEGTVSENKAGVPVIDPELYLRWLQFGVFNPILRFHSAPGSGSRRPEDYDVDLGGACAFWLRIRHRMLPYLQNAARETHETGLPVVRGLFLHHPEDPNSYRFDSYYFGSFLLVAPMLEKSNTRSVYLPSSSVSGADLWWDFLLGEPVSAGTFERTVSLAEVPVYAPAGSVIPLLDVGVSVENDGFSEVVLRVFPGASGNGELCEDDGKSEGEEVCKTSFEYLETGSDFVFSIQSVEGAPAVPFRTVHLEFPLAAEIKALSFEGSELSAVPSNEPGWMRFTLENLSPSQSWSVRGRRSVPTR